VVERACNAREREVTAVQAPGMQFYHASALCGSTARTADFPKFHALQITLLFRY
jgi:hypothetical protein